MSSRVVSAYRNLLRAGSGFTVRRAPAPAALCARAPLLTHAPLFPRQDYNVREYIVRRTRTDFRKNRALTGAAAAAALQSASDALALVRRQASISQSFASAEPSVMEAVSAAKKARGGAPAATDGAAATDKTGAGGDPEEM